RVQSANRDEGEGSGAILPFCDPVDSLRCPLHRLENRRVDGTQSNVVRLRRQSGFEFGMVVGRQAQLQPGLPDRRQVRRGEVLLAEMNEIATLIDREPPMVVDDELTALRLTCLFRAANLGSQRSLLHVLDTKLDEP